MLLLPEREVRSVRCGHAVLGKQYWEGKVSRGKGTKTAKRQLSSTDGKRLKRSGNSLRL